jgi:hypothetical protein
MVLIDKEETQWNPVKKKFMPWIDLVVLETMHGSKGHRNKNTLQRGLHSFNRTNRPKIDAPDPPPASQKNEPLFFGHAPRVHQRPCHSRRVSASPPESNIIAIRRFLLMIPLMFPPTNTTVEPHEYFTKWTKFDSEAFAGVNSDEQIALLLRGMTFLHNFRL